MKNKFNGKKDLFWLVVSELRVHGHLASSVTWSIMEAKGAREVVARKQRDKKQGT